MLNYQFQHNVPLHHIIEPVVTGPSEVSSLLVGLSKEKQTRARVVSVLSPTPFLSSPCWFLSSDWTNSTSVKLWSTFGCSAAVVDVAVRNQPAAQRRASR